MNIIISFAGLGETGDTNLPLEEFSAIAGSLHAEIRAVDDYESFDIILPKSII